MSKPNFGKINKALVQIESVKVQLRKVTTLEDLMQLADIIVQMEILLVTENSTGYNALNDEKKKVQHKITDLQKNLEMAESQLKDIETRLNKKLRTYKKTYEERILELVPNIDSD